MPEGWPIPREAIQAANDAMNELHRANQDGGRRVVILGDQYAEAALQAALPWLSPAVPEGLPAEPRYRCANGHEWTTMVRAPYAMKCPHCGTITLDQVDSTPGLAALSEEELDRVVHVLAYWLAKQRDDEPQEPIRETEKILRKLRAELASAPRREADVRR